MSAIIESVLNQSGLSVYAVIRDSSGQVWNGSTFAAYNSANWATYVVSLTEQTGSGYYLAAFPSAIVSGIYSFTVHQGSGVLGDIAIDRGSIDWNGTTQNYLGMVTVKLPTGTISNFDASINVVQLNPSQTSVTIGSVSSLGTIAQNQISSTVYGNLNSLGVAELNSVPNATASIGQMLKFLYMALRNKRTSDSVSVKIYNSAGTVIGTATQADNGLVYTKENFS
jgi:hypothetical protein